MNAEKNSKILPLAAALYLPLSGGFDFVFIEYILKYIDSVTLVCVRLIVVSLLLHLAHRVMQGPFRVEKGDMLRFLIAGGLGTGVYYIFEAIGIGMTSAALSSIILAMVPLFGLFGDRIANGTAITVRKLIGVTVSIIGVIIIVFGAGSSEISGTLLGVGLLFMAAIFWALYILIAKPLNGTYSTMTVTTGVFSAGAIVDIPIFFLYKPSNILTLSPGNFFLIILFAVICIGLANLLYMYGVGKLPIIVSSILMNVLPVVTVIVSWIVFHETLTALQLFGGALIIASVIVITVERTA
ncbi:MAG: DMT family transporter [Clostridia bacterium]|nr:DMT family transporter [Clostridia bacterium]